MKWRIRKARKPLTWDGNPARPWQLWLVAGENMGLIAERSSFAYVVQAMVRYNEANAC